MRILLASDAWPPQVNGVVRTMLAVTRELEALGHIVIPLTPDRFHTVPCPFYREIRLAINPMGKVGEIIEEARADAVHIVTEGPIGIATRRWCLRAGIDFTTAYHTRFPEYLAARYVAPRRFTYALLRRFHAPSRGVMVATDSVRKELEAHGFANLVPWGRGVDPSLFDPSWRDEMPEYPRPIFLSVGRVAPEKNLPAFLSLDLPGSKVVVGEGPALASLRRRFPTAHFIGRRENASLARLYASADVFVFPSRTDTFGLVMLEALASGLPVAAYPVPGPLDVIGDSGAGVLDVDLARAARRALAISREHCRAHALSFTWAQCAHQFLDRLHPAR
jgi:1,2-diacylglycerol 3-alpha-glucosyltransferase/glucuronosyltransferase